jgi:hypothetical protein
VACTRESAALTDRICQGVSPVLFSFSDMVNFCPVYSIWLCNLYMKYVKAIKRRQLKSFTIAIPLSADYDHAKALSPLVSVGKTLS